jgi:hypothetical protein
MGPVARFDLVGAVLVLVSLSFAPSAQAQELCSNWVWNNDRLEDFVVNCHRMDENGSQLELVAAVGALLQPDGFNRMDTYMYSFGKGICESQSVVCTFTANLVDWSEFRQRDVFYYDGPNPVPFILVSCSCDR